MEKQEKTKITDNTAKKQAQHDIVSDPDLQPAPASDDLDEGELARKDNSDEKEIERIGGRETIKTNVRIIAATNRNLETELMKGRFRNDLYYRLNVFTIELPPLRDRKPDIPELVNHFLAIHADRNGSTKKQVSSAVLKQLTDYDWPGNIRELEHVIERAVLINSSDVIGSLYLPKQKPAEVLLNGEKIKTIDEVERDHILFVLRKTNGKLRGKAGAAELLQIAPSTLQSKMKRLGIRKVAF